jgi:methionyl-tRNA formyltransferase
MRIIFFGTPQFAVPSLEALLAAGHDVVAVVTQPDRPHPRHHTQTVPPPVKVCAAAAGIPVLQPDRPRGEDFCQQLRACHADLGVVVAYGHLLRPEVLAIPRLGLVNVHASLLPRWRGAAPIHWAVKSGDAETGVAIMRLEQGLDTGAVWHVRRTAILPTDTTGTLFTRLATLGAEALVEALPRIAAGEPPTPQADAGVTHAPKVERADARIVWDAPVATVVNQIRAMDPAPGAWTTLDGQSIKLFGGTADVAQPSTGAAPGTIEIVDGTPVVHCADGTLSLADVQPAGKPRMAARTWANGLDRAHGPRFE